MAADPKNKPSFSPVRRWSIGFNVALIIAVVLSVVLMVNYLSRDYFSRFYWSSRSEAELSPLTAKFLQSLTNQVKVTVYYDREESSYSTVVSLLNEYHYANPRISVETVDYLRDAGAAQKIKSQYLTTFPSSTNLVIFDCEGRIKAIDGNALTQYTLEAVPNDKQREFRRKPVAFMGEKLFTGALLAITSGREFNADFLQGHGEHRLDSPDELDGFQKFRDVVRANYIRPRTLNLQGTNEIPADCHLLVIAGPKTSLLTNELEKIDRYLAQGGRLLALFNADTLTNRTGLESILFKWGIGIGNKIVRDPAHSERGEDVIVSTFKNHPLVNPLLGSGLYMLQPRPVGKYPQAASSADAPKVDVVAFSGEHALLEGAADKKEQQVPLIAVSEQGAIKGVVTERGATRIVVAGDSHMFCNGPIDLLANRDFAACVLNWLLDRNQLLEGLGPRPITEYRLLMTPRQIRTANWLLLGAMPGSVLALGGLVWMRRRR